MCAQNEEIFSITICFVFLILCLKRVTFLWVQVMLHNGQFFQSCWEFQSKSKVFKTLLWDVLPCALFDSYFFRVVYSECRSSRLLRNVRDCYQATQSQIRRLQPSKSELQIPQEQLNSLCKNVFMAMLKSSAGNGIS